MGNPEPQDIGSCDAPGPTPSSPYRSVYILRKEKSGATGQWAIEKWGCYGAQSSERGILESAKEKKYVVTMYFIC